MSCFVPNFRVYHAVDMHGFIPRRKNSFLNSSIATRTTQNANGIKKNSTGMGFVLKRLLKNGTYMIINMKTMLENWPTKSHKLRWALRNGRL